MLSTGANGRRDGQPLSSTGTMSALPTGGLWPLAGLLRVCSKGAAPTAAISRAWKAGWIIATGNGNTGAGSRERA